jgi:hypothetical protein
LPVGRGRRFEGSGGGCQNGSPLEELAALRHQSWWERTDSTKRQRG